MNKIRLFCWILKNHILFNPRLLRNRMYLVHPTLYRISKNSTIQVNKKFTFNLNWIKQFNGRNLRNGTLVIGDNASFHIGEFIAYFGSTIHVENNARLSIGSGYMNINATICCSKSISIGNNVYIADNVEIRDNDYHSIIGSENESCQAITIEDNVWIGMNSLILKGVHLGEGCVIAAGSVVTKDVPSHCLAAGVPAKVIKDNVYHH